MRNNGFLDENKTRYNLLSVSPSVDTAGQDKSSARSSSVQMTVSWADLQPSAARQDGCFGLVTDFVFSTQSLTYVRPNRNCIRFPGSRIESSAIPTGVEVALLLKEVG